MSKNEGSYTAETGLALADLFRRGGPAVADLEEVCRRAVEGRASEAEVGVAWQQALERIRGLAELLAGTAERGTPQ